jgi:hypothetical protein
MSCIHYLTNSACGQNLLPDRVAYRGLAVKVEEPLWAPLKSLTANALEEDSLSLISVDLRTGPVSATESAQGIDLGLEAVVPVLLELVLSLEPSDFLFKCLDTVFHVLLH